MSNKSTEQSNGGDFWAKNGPGIMRGTGAVLSTTFKAGKFVGKSAYSAGHAHYKNQKIRRQDGDTKKETSESSHTSTPVQNLTPVHNFAPPPLKAGQMQYQPGGSVVAADKPIARQENYKSVTTQVNQPSGGTQVIAADSLQPLYNAQGQVIGYIPNQAAPAAVPSQGNTNYLGAVPAQSSNDAAPPIGPRPGAREVPQPQAQTSAPLPPNRMQPNNTATSLTESNESSTLITNPYKYISPEERAEQKKLVIDNKIDVFKAAPPPVHAGRGQNAAKKFSEVVDEKIKGVTPGRVTSENSSLKGMSANNTNNSMTSPKPEEKEIPAVLGKYDYAKKPEYKPPPKANVPEGFGPPSARLQKTTLPQRSEHPQVVKPVSESAPVEPERKVLGSYDYNKATQFAPPPSAKRSERDMEFISVKQERTRIITDKQHTAVSAEGIPNRAEPVSSDTPPKPSKPMALAAPPKPAKPTALEVPTRKVSSSISRNSSVSSVRSPVQAQKSENEPKAKVLGSYDYNKTTQFAPPPSAKRSERDMEFINQKNERSRITTNRNMRDQRAYDGERHSVSGPSEPPSPVVHTPVASTPSGTTMMHFAPPPTQKRSERDMEFINRRGGRGKLDEDLCYGRNTVLAEMSLDDVPPPDYVDFDNLDAPPKKPSKPSALAAPPKPKKPSALSAPPKPTQISGISERVKQFSMEGDNPFERYDPSSAV